MEINKGIIKGCIRETEVRLEKTMAQFQEKDTASNDINLIREYLDNIGYLKVVLGILQSLVEGK